LRIPPITKLAGPSTVVVQYAMFLSFSVVIVRSPLVSRGWVPSHPALYQFVERDPRKSTDDENRPGLPD
jgi:hypothetical protein